jgi:hypothetical protein
MKAGGQQHLARVFHAVAAVALLLVLCASISDKGQIPGPRAARTGGTIVLQQDAAADNAAAGTESPLFAQAFNEQTEDPAAFKSSKTMDDMPDDVKALFAQASGEQQTDPAHGNSSNVHEMPDAIKAWLEDMKKHVSVNPTDTINVTVCLPFALITANGFQPSILLCLDATVGAVSC